MQRRQFVLTGAAALTGACSRPASSVPADAPDGPPGGKPNPSPLYNWTNGRIPQRPDIGWSVLTLPNGGSAGQNGFRSYLMQSVFKLWLAAALLDDVDRGARRLDDPVTITRADLGYPYQPVAEKVGPDGYHTTLHDLLRFIVIQSDNPSAEVLLKAYGGPAKLTAWLKAKGIEGVRVDGGERALHAQAAEIDAATGERQNELVDRFVGGTADGSTPNSATPDGAAAALGKLYRGELLSPASTRLLLATMAETVTGEKRIRAGLEPGWKWAHKTGTGGHANGQTRTLGVGDIGILTAPDGDAYAVAMFVGGAPEPMDTQEGWFADLARGVVAAWKKDKAVASD